MEKMILDKNSKELLEKVSALFGVKNEIVREVWEYTVFTWLLSMSDENKKLKQLTVPFLGNIGLKFKDSTIDNSTGKIECECDAFIALSDSFKDMVKGIENNHSKELAEYLQNKIKKVANQII